MTLAAHGGIGDAQTATTLDEQPGSLEMRCAFLAIEVGEIEEQFGDAPWKERQNVTDSLWDAYHTLQRMLRAT